MRMPIFPGCLIPPTTQSKGRVSSQRRVNLLVPPKRKGSKRKLPARLPLRWGTPTTPMTGLLARSAGFYLALLPPFALQHLSMQFRFTAFLDAVLNALLVTWAFFTGGTLLGLFGKRRRRGLLDEIFIGGVTSGMMMSFLWQGPSLLERFDGVLDRWLSPAALLLAWGLGVLVTPLKRSGRSLPPPNLPASGKARSPLAGKSS